MNRNFQRMRSIVYKSEVMRFSKESPGLFPIGERFNFTNVRSYLWRSLNVMFNPLFSDGFDHLVLYNKPGRWFVVLIKGSTC